MASEEPADTPKDHACPKCGHTEADVGKIAATGSGLTRLFDIQTNQFKVVSCQNCGYSELYRDRGKESRTSDVVDLFFG